MKKVTQRFVASRHFSTNARAYAKISIEDCMSRVLTELMQNIALSMEYGERHDHPLMPCIQGFRSSVHRDYDASINLKIRVSPYEDEVVAEAIVEV